MIITLAQQEAIMFAIAQIEGDIESAEDEDYIQQARQALKELNLIINKKGGKQ